MESERDNAIKLLERNRVGVIMRVFAESPGAVGHQVSSAMDAVRRVLTLRTGDRATFARVDLIVSSDPDYDDTDCGLTAEELRTRVRAEFPNAPVHVSELKKGDIYCMLLNYGVANQLEDRVSYSVMLSHSVSSYATQENVDALLSAMYRKARVAGVAISELRELVTKGYIMDTFAIWHNKSLVTVGGFDLRASKPRREHKHAHPKVTGWSETKADRHGDGAVEYHVAGCEEVIPLIRMVKNFGPCIRVVEPKGVGMEWKEANPDIDPYAYHRHLAKLATKVDRLHRMALIEGSPLEIIESGLMHD